MFFLFSLVPVVSELIEWTVSMIVSFSGRNWSHLRICISIIPLRRNIWQLHCLIHLISLSLFSIFNLFFKFFQFRFWLLSPVVLSYIYWMISSFHNNRFLLVFFETVFQFLDRKRLKEFYFVQYLTIWFKSYRHLFKK